jgi:hypothetical protein
MRILFLHHLPLDVGPVGQLLRRWAHALLETGNEVRLVTAGQAAAAKADFVVENVVCSATEARADLNFPPPDFSATAPQHGAIPFGELSDRQLAEYRDRLRRLIDKHIDQFDPQVLHAQHVWVNGQLAVETGVPYVLSAWSEELADSRDERYRVLAEQAAENAAQILTPDAALAAEVVRRFGAERTWVMPSVLFGATATSAAPSPLSETLLEVYRGALARRFG